MVPHGINQRHYDIVLYYCTQSNVYFCLCPAMIALTVATTVLFFAGGFLGELNYFTPATIIEKIANLQGVCVLAKQLLVYINFEIPHTFSVCTCLSALHTVGPAKSASGSPCGVILTIPVFNKDAYIWFLTVS